MLSFADAPFLCKDIFYDAMCLLIMLDGGTKGSFQVQIPNVECLKVIFYVCYNA